jgi:curli biogenesis system outer membrane secretion channel CsgG
MKRLTVSLLALLAASVLAAPAFAGSKKAPASIDHVMVGQAPMMNVSPIDNGFKCFSKFIQAQTAKPVFAVGRLTDQSGKFSNEASAGGFAVTQGLTAMAYTSYGKMGLGNQVIERTDMSVVEADMAIFDRAKNQFGQGFLLGDSNGRPEQSGVDKNGKPVYTNVRTVGVGQYPGADYYVTGSISEVNYNIDSGGGEIAVQGIGIGNRTYTMSVALDLRIVDAKTLRVVAFANPVKKYTGKEVKAGVFNFLGDYLIDINVGKKAQEPLQLGIRATLESAMIDMVGQVYGSDYGKTCTSYASQTYGNLQSPVGQADPVGDMVESTNK